MAMSFEALPASWRNGGFVVVVVVVVVDADVAVVAVVIISIVFVFVVVVVDAVLVEKSMLGASLMKTSNMLLEAG